MKQLYIVILLEKSILNGIGKGRKEMEDGGKFSLGVMAISLEKGVFFYKKENSPAKRFQIGMPLSSVIAIAQNFSMGLRSGE
jgi:hypothetical protein